MNANIQYINLSWAVVGVCESPAMPLWKIIPAPSFLPCHAPSADSPDGI